MGVRHEERTRETAVLIGQAHHHEPAARPDVQALRIHLRRAIGMGGKGDLLVVVLDVFLAVGEATLHHLLAHGAERTIATEDHIGLHIDRRASLGLETTCGMFQIDIHALVVEVEFDVGQLLCFGEQTTVQFATRNGMDRPVVDAVRHTVQLAIAVVHHAGMDRHGDLLHSFLQAGSAQGGPSAMAYDQVDASPRIHIGLARVAAALVDVHRMTALRQEHGEQASYKPPADDGDVAHDIDDLRISAKRWTSSNELYKGTGAIRNTSGSRQSQTTPCSVSRLKIPRPSPSTRMESCAPLCA